MEGTLNDAEIRILGCLIEKEFTTPDYYPLTLNSLTAACNQKSNRNPAVSFEEPFVEQALDALRKRGLVQALHMSGSRTAKYRHSFLEEFKLIPGEAAVLCELMLRGPQTVGEIRTRAERMYKFRGLEEVDETLRDLMDRGLPLVCRLQREPGKREERYAHLLSGIPEAGEGRQAPPVAASKQDTEEGRRIAKLEQETAELREELEKLRSEFKEFKAQF